VGAFYKRNHRLPRSNAEAGLPEADKIVSTYVTRLEVKDGAIHLQLGHRINKFASGKIVSVRPALAPSPMVPLSWACGNAVMPEALKVSGQNATNLESPYLPIDCRT
jgi:type IV pilus assembly protein PilA